MIHDQEERAVVCPHCHHIVYPKIVPAVIVGVINGEEILLTRYAKGFAHNALIAGFTEIGETLEECVQREVYEEVGLKVKNIRYYKSQPWGFVDDLLVGFYCEVDGDPTIDLDTSELKSGIWTKREDIVLQPDELSLTNEMMKMFKESKI
jgi:NAD+ diphosphatase